MATVKPEKWSLDDFQSCILMYNLNIMCFLHFISVFCVCFHQWSLPLGNSSVTHKEKFSVSQQLDSTETCVCSCVHACVVSSSAEIIGNWIKHVSCSLRWVNESQTKIKITVIFGRSSSSSSYCCSPVKWCVRGASDITHSSGIRVIHCVTKESSCGTSERPWTQQHRKVWRVTACCCSTAAQTQQEPAAENRPGVDTLSAFSRDFPPLKMRYSYNIMI